MKKKDIKELKLKKKEDLVKTLLAKKKDYISVAVKKMGKKAEKNVKELWNLRREIAILSTLVREKEIIEKEAEKR